VVQAWIGLTVHPIDAELAAYLNIQSDAGVIVTGVEPQSPAATAGFGEGDIILAVDEAKINDISAYRSTMNMVSADQTLAFEISRKNKKKRLLLKTAVFPLEQALNLASNRLGIDVSSLDNQTRSKYGIRTRHGVLIIKMKRGSHLSRIGVRPGDIIRQIDEARVDDLEDFKMAMVKYRNKPSVVLLIERDGYLYHINATMKDNRG